MGKIKKHRTKGQVLLRVVVSLVVTLAIIIGLYLVAAYSEIPFIKKWRTIYIETAMSTLSHQWLATELLPADKVNEVVEDAMKIQEEAAIEENTVKVPTIATIWLGAPMGLNEDQTFKKELMALYDEIDWDTVPDKDIETYENLVLDESYNVKTVNGDSVYVLDTVNGVTIINVKGEGFVGKLAIIKDPSRVKLGVTSKSYSGETVREVASNYDAVLAINASGFVDPNGNGNGGEPIGLVKSFGTLKQEAAEGWYWIRAGFDYSDNFRIGYGLNVKDLRDAVQFNPILIADGEQKMFGSAGIGIHPRTAIGQTKDNEVVFLIIDGRQIGYSLGATVGQCADLLMTYDVENAINMDGGASSAMVYKGKTITIPSEWEGPHQNPDGRRVPDAWIVTPLED